MKLRKARHYLQLTLLCTKDHDHVLDPCLLSDLETHAEDLQHNLHKMQPDLKLTYLNFFG